MQNAARQQMVEVLGGKYGQAYQNSSLLGKVFSSIWRDFQGCFSVDTYRNTRVLDLQNAKYLAQSSRDHVQSNFDQSFVM
ncbi:ORF6C domain-containing protein [Brevibacillus sp. HB1.4B]|uniref:ORF6C domain-containing protein n=1 Tax=Brevibacillus sp. HB1.4B TaxID=2738845 RepID=UPI00156A7A3C|nr:ORF6C domain-containing protein [Brevibacillus sp. HB1.4B]